MKRKDVHVTHREDGWQVKVAGSAKAARVAPTRAEARDIGRQIAMHNQSELVIHRLDGTIGEKNSYFNPDPCPPRG